MTAEDAPDALRRVLDLYGKALEAAWRRDEQLASMLLTAMIPDATQLRDYLARAARSSWRILP